MGRVSRALLMEDGAQVHQIENWRMEKITPYREAKMAYK